MKAKAKKITEEDFDAWRGNPITQTVFAYLEDRVNLARDVWSAQMGSRGTSPEQLSDLRIELAAKVELMEDMINLELKDIQEDDTDEGKVVALPGRR